jgi:hypothetical protein
LPRIDCFEKRRRMQEEEEKLPSCVQQRRLLLESHIDIGLLSEALLESPKTSAIFGKSKPEAVLPSSKFAENEILKENLGVIHQLQQQPMFISSADNGGTDEQQHPQQQSIENFAIEPRVPRAVSKTVIFVSRKNFHDTVQDLTVYCKAKWFLIAESRETHNLVGIANSGATAQRWTKLWNESPEHYWVAKTNAPDAVTTFLNSCPQFFPNPRESEINVHLHQQQTNLNNMHDCQQQLQATQELGQANKNGSNSFGFPKAPIFDHNKRRNQNFKGVNKFDQFASSNNSSAELYQELYRQGVAGVTRAAKAGIINPAQLGQTMEGLKTFEILQKKEEMQGEPFSFPIHAWQETLFENVLVSKKRKYNRAIVFLVDPIGGVGKSNYGAYLCSTRSKEFQQLTMMANENDFFHKAEPEVPTYLIDIPRSKDPKLGVKLDYTILEKLKSGVFTNGKYHGNERHSWKDPPSVVVSMNDLPDLAVLSHDKYEVYFITQMVDGCWLVSVPLSKIPTSGTLHKRRLENWRKDEEMGTTQSYNFWLYHYLFEACCAHHQEEGANILSKLPHDFATYQEQQQMQQQLQAQNNQDSGEEDDDILSRVEEEVDGQTQEQQQKNQLLLQEAEVELLAFEHQQAEMSIIEREVAVVQQQQSEFRPLQLQKQHAAAVEISLEQQQPEDHVPLSKRRSEGDEEEVANSKGPRKHICSTTTDSRDLESILSPTLSITSFQQQLAHASKRVTATPNEASTECEDSALFALLQRQIVETNYQQQQSMSSETTIRKLTEVSPTTSSFIITESPKEMFENSQKLPLSLRKKLQMTNIQKKDNTLEQRPFKTNNTRMNENKKSFEQNMMEGEAKENLPPSPFLLLK